MNSPNAQSGGGRPNCFDQRPGIFPSQTIALLVNLQVLVADHVQQHAPTIAIFGRLVDIFPGKIFRPQEKTASGENMNSSPSKNRKSMPYLQSILGMSCANSISSATPPALSFAPRNTPRGLLLSIREKAKYRNGRTRGCAPCSPGASAQSYWPSERANCLMDGAPGTAETQLRRQVF